MLCGFLLTSTHPHSVPSTQGHPGCPSFRLQGKRQLQSFILMSLLSRVMARTRHETRSFSVKTQLLELSPKGLLFARCCCSQLLLPEGSRGSRLGRKEDFVLSYFSFLPLILPKACPELSFPKRRAMIWPLEAATGPSRLSVLDQHP